MLIALGSSLAIIAQTQAVRLLVAAFAPECGDVGIGTVTPTQLLHLSSVAGPSALIDATPGSGQAGLKMIAGSGTTNRATRIDFLNGVSSTTVPRWTILNDYNQNGTNDLGIADSSSVPVFTIRQGGNVGIGTTAPSGLLDVGNGSGTSYLVVSATTGPGTVLGASSTINATVPQNGSAKVCLVSVTTRAGQRVMVVGQATWSNNGTNSPIGADTAMWLARGGTQITPNKSVFTSMYYTMHTQTWTDAPGSGTFEYAVYGQESTNRTTPALQTCFIQVTSLN